MRKIFFVILVVVFNISDVICAEPTNNVIFEKMESEILDHNWVAYMDNEWKLIARNVIKINLTLILKRPVNTAWFHFQLHLQSSSNVYRKYLVDLWENLCESLNGTTVAPVTKYFLDNISTLKIDFNIPLKCPFTGTITIMHPGLNASAVNVPLLSAGRYRMALYVATHKGKSPIFVYRFYFGISDIRVWF